MQPPDRLRLLPALRRRGWLLLLCTVAVAALAVGFASVKGKSYSTNLVLVVSLHNEAQPLADEADKLATTYAGVITNDNNVLNRLGAALGLSSTEVKENLEVTADENTSLIHAVYTGSSASKAITAARILDRSLTGPNPITPNIAPRTLRAVQVPTEASVSGGGTTKAGVIGLVLGLFLGFLLLLAWERADPRLDDAGQLAAETALPSSEFASVKDGGLDALLARWRELAGAPADRPPGLTPPRLAVSLIAADARSQGAARVLAALLDAHPAVDVGVAEAGSDDARGFPVLVVRAGASLNATRKRLGIATDLGRAPQWGVFLTRRQASRRAQRAATAATQDPPAAPPVETPEPQGSFT